MVVGRATKLLKISLHLTVEVISSVSFSSYQHILLVSDLLMQVSFLPFILHFLGFLRVENYCIFCDLTVTSMIMILLLIIQSYGLSRWLSICHDRPSGLLIYSRWTGDLCKPARFTLKQFKLVFYLSPSWE